MPDTKPRVAGQGKMGPAPITPARRNDSNAQNNQAGANRNMHAKGDFKSGTSGGSTWPKLSN